MNLWREAKEIDLGVRDENTIFTVDLNDYLREEFQISDTSFSVISGTLPQGVRLDQHKIVGSAFEVSRRTHYNFVIRATLHDQIDDRSFTLDVEGADEPEWVTSEGLLPIGNNRTLFILDSVPVSFYLQAVDPDLAAGQQLIYFIASGDGELPPGVKLNQNGRICGVIDPILSLENLARQQRGMFDATPFDSAPYDFGIRPDNGYDSFFYDTVPYDYSFPSQLPKKLNRKYQFRVSVTDGDSIIKRDFQLFVVSDDFLTADNTQLLSSNTIFTADSTFVRTPIWLTPRNLGYRRSDNYVTLYLDVLDTNLIPGFVSYNLVHFNDDGSPSVIPPGLVLDGATGELAGKVPHQPSQTRDYKFTVQATRYAGADRRDRVTIRIFETINRGPTGSTTVDGVVREHTDIKIYKNNDNQVTVSFYLTSAQGAGRDLQYTFSTNSDIEAPGSGIIKFNNQTFQSIDEIYISNNDRNGTNTLDFLSSVVGDSGTTLGQLLIRPRNINNTTQAYFDVTEIENRDDFYVLKVTPRFGSIPVYDFSRLAGRTFLIKGNYYQITRVITNNPVFDVLRLGVPLQTFLAKDKEYTDLVLVQPGTSNIARSRKTFEVRMLGAIDSIISWISDTNLGVIDANQTSLLSIQAQSTINFTNLRYEILNGQLPPGLKLSLTGEITGRVQQFGQDIYQSLWRASRDYLAGNIVKVDNVFYRCLVDHTSTLFDNDSTKWEQFIYSKAGLTMLDTNTVKLDTDLTTVDRVFSFQVQAQDPFGFGRERKVFRIRVQQPNTLTYSNLFVKPLFNVTQRESYRNFITDPNIFDYSLIYRPGDLEFGVQNQVKMLVYAGIETKSIEHYVSAVAMNHRRRKFKFGSLSAAVAKIPGTNQPVYEVVYVQIIDDRDALFGVSNSKLRIKTKNPRLVNSTSFDSFYIQQPSLIEIPRLRSRNSHLQIDSTALTVDQELDSVRYISNLTSMRQNISQVGDNNQQFLPLWMRTVQTNSPVPLGYVPAVVLAYCKVGTSSILLKNILKSGFDFSTLNFEVDRYIIDSTLGVSNEQYILFKNYDFNI